jgi:hypothetical protein
VTCWPPPLPLPPLPLPAPLPEDDELDPPHAHRNKREDVASNTATVKEELRNPFFAIRSMLIKLNHFATILRAGTNAKRTMIVPVRWYSGKARIIPRATIIKLASTGIAGVPQDFELIPPDGDNKSEAPRILIL